MNPTILVPNIFITTNPDLASQFRDPNKKYTSLAAFTKDAEAMFGNDEFLVISTDNTEITRFEFDIAGVRAAGSPPKCVIEFIDTGKAFELEFLASVKKRVISSNGLYEKLKGIFYIAFGVGDNLSYWSSFLGVVLIGTQIFGDFDQPKTIQMTFAVGAGYHNVFTSISSDLIDDDVLGNIDFSTKSGGRFFGPSKLTELALTNKEDPFNKNSDLIAKYLLGFNNADYLLKYILNSFLRKIFNQSANVFIVTDDLLSLGFHRNYLLHGDDITGYANGRFSKGNKPAKESVEGFQKRGEMLAAFIESDVSLKKFFEVPNLDSKAGQYRSDCKKLMPIYSKLLNIDLTLQESLSIRAVDVGLKMPFQIDDSGEEPATAEEVKAALTDGLKNLKIGLETLFPGSAKVPCSLVRESDAQIVTYFISLFSEEAKKVLGLSTELPLILFGNQKLIRAMLYGESFEGSVSKDVTDNTYPTNEKAFNYLNASWLSKDLYGSHPKGEEIQTLEELLSQSQQLNVKSNALAYDNFPIFKYNIGNPNVLSVSVTDNAAFLQLMMASVPVTKQRYDEYSKYKRDTKILGQAAENVDEFITEELRQARQKAADDRQRVNSIFKDLLEDIIADRYGKGIDSEYYKYTEFAFGNGSPSSVELQNDSNRPKPMGQALTQAGSDLRDIIKDLADKDKTQYVLSTLTLQLARLKIDEDEDRRSSISGDSFFKLNSTESDYQDYIFSIRDIVSSELGIGPKKLSQETQSRKNEIDFYLNTDLGFYGEQFTHTLNKKKAPFKGVNDVKLKLLFYTLLETLALAKLNEKQKRKENLPPYVYELLEVMRLNSKTQNIGNYLPLGEKGIIESEDLRDRLLKAKEDSEVLLKGAEISFDTVKIYDDLLTLIDQYPLQVEIKTLPFFNISNFFWLGYPCLLFARRPKLLGMTQEYAIDSLLSGAYKIIGMKHEISQNNCYSTFTLIKQQDVRKETEED